MQALYAAKMGLKVQQNRVSTIANNISNVNTYGYKSQRVDFKDAMYAQVLNPADLARTDIMQGTGVLMTATNRDLTQGSTVNTGQTLDMFIDGNGYFTTQDANGTITYTRSGCFGVSAEADGNYLVAANGDYVMNDQMGRIKIPDDAADIMVGTDGEMKSGDTSFAMLNIVTFTNRNGLSAVGEGGFVETVASGAPIESDAMVRQGALETSNVDLAVELSRLIRAQKAFALAGKAVSTWDEMEAATNNLRA